MIKNKRFRYGTFSIVFLLLAFVLFVFVNLFADRFDYTQDLTQEQIFTLSDQSRTFLAELDEDISITLISRIGQGHPVFFPILERLLAEYDAASSYITVEHRDPALSPNLVHDFAQRANHTGGIPDESVVIENSRGLYVLTLSDMVAVNTNMFGQAVSIRSYNFESEITRTIHRLTQTEPPIVYFVTGSGEFPLNPGLAAFLQAENFDVREANLLIEEVPSDTDILVITMPQRDWPREKAERVLGFLEQNGRAFFALNYTTVEMPVLDSVLEMYGLVLGSNIIFEGNPANILQNPTFILPNYVEHEIFDSIVENSMFNLLIDAVALGRAENMRGSLAVEPLWITSEAAFARVESSDSAIQLPSDMPGPFGLAVTVTDRRLVAGETVITRLVAVGNTAIMSDAINSTIGGGNAVFVRDSLNWLLDQPAGIFIPGRVPPGSAPVLITQLQTNVISIVVLGLIPVGLLATGMLIWLKRRQA